MPNTFVSCVEIKSHTDEKGIIKWGLAWNNQKRHKHYSSHYIYNSEIAALEDVGKATLAFIEYRILTIYLQSCSNGILVG
jgi:hypothetical protein